MFVVIIAFLSVVQLIFAEDLTEGKILAANVYDDDALKEILISLDLLEKTNGLRIDLQNFNMDQKFTKLLNEFRKDMDQQHDELKKNIDQLRNEFKKDIDQGFTQQQNEFKKAMNQQKNEFKEDMNQQKNEFKKDMDQQHDEFKKNIDQLRNEFKKDMDQGFTQQQNEFKNAIDQQKNEFKKDFEDLKLTTRNQHQKRDGGLLTFLVRSTNQLASNCNQALGNFGKSGIYKIKLRNSKLEPFNVYCLSPESIDLEDLELKPSDVYCQSPVSSSSSDLDSSNGAWMVVQRRQDGSVNFYRNWTDYQNGFGDLNGEFFIGLEKLHELTKSSLHELRIQMGDFEGNTRWAKYSSFAIGSEKEGYKLSNLGAYRGNAGDSLSRHVGQKWSTYDVDNDKNLNGSCAFYYRGAWWYENCDDSNLNGLYLHGVHDKYGKGIEWFTWLGPWYSLKDVQMAIRPVQ